MAAGIEAGSRGDAAEARLAVVQQWKGAQAQYEQAGIKTPYGQSQQFQLLVEQYEKQLQMEIDQQINKTEFGPLGARAATVGNINAQGIQGA